jgi:hypothetical protein
VNCGTSTRSGERHDNRRERQLLGLILLAAFLFRIATISWGILPIRYSKSFHPDEYKYLDPAVKVEDYYLTAKPFPMYGTSIQYAVGAWLLPVRAALERSGLESSSATVTHLACRLVTILLGTLAVFLVFRLGVQTFDTRTGIVAAAFLAVSVLHSLNSAIFTIDVPMSTLVLAFLLLCLRVLRDDGIANYSWLGVAAGFTLGTKFTAAAILIVPLTLIVLGAWPTRDRRRLVRGVALAAASGAATFLALNPQYVLGFGAIYDYALQEKAEVFDRMAPLSLADALFKATAAIAEAVGLPVAGLAVAGAVLARAGAWRMRVAMLVLIVLHPVIFWSYMQPRYILVVAPLICLFAAHACVELLRRGTAPGRAASALAIAVTLGASSVALVRGIGSRLSDPRLSAARFIESRYGAGTTVAFSAVSLKYARTHSWRYPRLVNPDHHQVGLFDRPDLIVTSSYDMRQIESALKSEHLSQGIVWDPAENARWYRYSPPSPRLMRFYSELAGASSPYVVVAIFEPSSEAGEFPPPEIRVLVRRAHGESVP